MIEVEKRFVDLTDDAMAALTTNAQLIKNKVNVDTYYDTSRYALTVSDRWLRKRNNRFELKIPIGTGGSKAATTQVYRELETDAEIYAALNLTQESTLENDLTNNGFDPFMTYTTTRSSYKNGEFTIDIDQSTYDAADLTYSGVDIEMMVDTEDEIAQATARILDFARSAGLTVDTNPLGKGGIYIKKTRPEHYKALVDAGVLPQT